MNSVLEEQKQRAQVGHLYAQIHIVGAGNIVAACLLVFIYWNQLNHAVLTGWLAAVLSVAAHRFYIAKAYRCRDRYSADSDKWYKIYANGALLKGCLWGAIGVYCARHVGAEQLPYMLMILGALVASTTITKSALFDIYTRFATPALVAPGLYLVAQFPTDQFMIGVLVLCWFVLMYSAARRFNQFVATSLGFEFENVALLTELEASRTRIVTLERNVQMQEKIITELQLSRDTQPVNCASGDGSRAKSENKSALKLARK